jgi:V/A-type H+-transporting ATPase subunit I
LEKFAVLTRLGETDQTFVLMGWTPERNVQRVREALAAGVGETIVVRVLPLTHADAKRAPVALVNPGPARPFESLVRLLALPRYEGIDPTMLMAFFLPIFFGMILGDVGYGALLLVLGFYLLRRFRKPGVARDIAQVLLMGSAWSIAFGFLYGEAVGAIAEKPEMVGLVILLIAIPETMVILGFAVAAMVLLMGGGLGG